MTIKKVLQGAYVTYQLDRFGRMPRYVDDLFFLATLVLGSLTSISIASNLPALISIVLGIATVILVLVLVLILYATYRLQVQNRQERDEAIQARIAHYREHPEDMPYRLRPLVDHPPLDKD